MIGISCPPKGDHLRLVYNRMVINAFVSVPVSERLALIEAEWALSVPLSQFFFKSFYFAY